jgi:hypothetical protein
MSTKKLGAIALLAVLPLGAIGVTAGVAEASTTPLAKISAAVSDATPTAGKMFTVSGTFTESGKAAAGQLVKVQAQQANGSWKTLTGAKEHTTTKGAYDVEVILNAKGQRDLRVVGVGAGTAPNAIQQLTVTVH